VLIGLALLAVGLILLVVALSITPGEVVDGDTTKADDGEPAGSGVTAFITAIAGLISSVAGLIGALTGLLALRRRAPVEPPSPPA
jgi:multisubunit Na+/H+ antiporter MnhB subunit